MIIDSVLIAHEVCQKECECVRRRSVNVTGLPFRVMIHQNRCVEQCYSQTIEARKSETFHTDVENSRYETVLERVENHVSVLTEHPSDFVC